MWPFSRSRTTIQARVRTLEDGRVSIDVRGQTCPGYLLAIDRAVASLPSDTEVEILISYPPCGDDVHAWCKARGLDYRGVRTEPGIWRVLLAT